MILLPNLPLPPQTAVQLTVLQHKVDSVPDYAQRVEFGKQEFARRNHIKDRVFQKVRETLSLICSGSQRCGYCEDSCADEVEHFKPKDLYPERVFDWENYIYACGPCNAPKKNSFAVFSDKTGRFLDVTRKKSDPIIPPDSGSAVLIDPRTENALDYMQIDLLGTFLFLPLAPKGTRDYERADYTIKVLRLNSRPALPKAREEAYRSYCARLHEYRLKNTSNSHTLNILASAVKRMAHPTIWQEMKRQHVRIPELHNLFQAVPQALTW